MTEKIETIEDVTTFFLQLKEEDLNFHPDTPFEDYVNIETNERIYTDEESQIRNKLLDDCFTICDDADVDIYELGMEILASDFIELQKKDKEK